MNKKKKFRRDGIILTLVGLFFLCIVYEFNSTVNEAVSNIPDDAKWYEARVSEIISSEKYRIKDEFHDRYEWVYDCEYNISYEINGKTHVFKCSDKKRDEEVKEGDYRYVKVRDEEPKRVYAISSSPSDNAIKITFTMFYVFVGGIIVIGVILLLLSFKKEKVPAEAEKSVAEELYE